MRWLIVADIHGNLPALEAVLATPEARSCQRVLSLGDHVNFGPCSGAVQRRLMGLGAVMLRGNHEDRLTHMEDFQGYSWGLLRHAYAQVRDLPLDFPLEARLGPALCTHGTPGDPWHLVDEAGALAELDRLPEDVRWLISGHNHRSWRVTRGGRTAFNPGSLGMLEDGRGGVAPFAVAEVEPERLTLRRCCAPYDTRPLRRAYLDSGAAQAAPELARAALHTMRSGEPQYCLRYVAHVRREAEQRGLTLAEETAWKAADHTWPWPEAMDSDTYWRKLYD